MSLRLRLATWYGTITGTVVLIVCVYSYLVHSRTHYDEVDLMLGGSASHIAPELDEAVTAEARQSILNAAHSLGAWAQIYDSRGAVVQESSGVGAVPVFDPASLQYDRTEKNVAAPGRRFSIYKAPEHEGAFTTFEARHRWRIVVVPLLGGQSRLAMIFPLDHIDASVRRFGFLMSIIGVLGAAAAFFIGWLISGRALRPISSLTEVALATARSGALSGRVPDGGEQDELGRLATAFNEMLSSLETAAVVQRRFLADASHELRAPLAVVLANLDLLSHPTGLTTDDRRAALEDARRESGRMSRLVADLLVLARSDSGLELEMQPVELDAILMNAMGDVRHFARNRSVRIGAVEPSVVMGNADSLKQLAIILLDNAIRYTPGEGRIDVSLTRSADGVTLTVTDTGIGISPAEVAHVFERFYRTESARSHDSRGSGLGLSIAKWIVEQHGGRIEVESVEGSGVRMSVKFPRLPV